MNRISFLSVCVNAWAKRDAGRCRGVIMAIFVIDCGFKWLEDQLLLFAPINPVAFCTDWIHD